MLLISSCQSQYELCYRTASFLLRGSQAGWAGARAWVAGNGNSDSNPAKLIHNRWARTVKLERRKVIQRVCSRTGQYVSVLGVAYHAPSHDAHIATEPTSRATVVSRDLRVILQKIRDPPVCWHESPYCSYGAEKAMDSPVEEAPRCPEALNLLLSAHG